MSHHQKRCGRKVKGRACEAYEVASLDAKEIRRKLTESLDRRGVKPWRFNKGSR